MKNSNNKLPDVDLPVDFLAMTDITEDILNFYRFPVRIKAGIFVLCLEGEMEATINLAEHRIGKNNLIVLAPGSIIQFHTMSGDTRIYFAGFSSGFLDRADLSKASLDFGAVTFENPVLPLQPADAEIYRDFIALLYKALSANRLQEKETLYCILVSLFSGVKRLYFEHAHGDRLLSRSENICKQLTKLVMKHFSSERRVSFYADRLHITPQHLSVTVKQVTGRTVSDVIAEVVVMDAKAKLKSTNMTVQEIADSLSFPNVSFFGKYFKRYTGMSPNEYRKS